MTVGKFKDDVHEFRRRLRTLADDLWQLRHGNGPTTVARISTAADMLERAESVLNQAAKACNGLEFTP
jgi:hypothetical protein